MLNRRRIDLILEREIIEAMGCTEPAAAALAGAKAAELFGMKPESGIAVVSPNMMKNAMGVSIPNSELHGIRAAVSLGIAIHDSSSGLSVLSTVTDRERKEAMEFPLDVRIDESAPSLYVKVSVFGSGHSASAVISGEHDRFTSLEMDGRALPEAPMFFPECKAFSEDDFLSTLTVADVVEYASELSPTISALLRKAVEENMTISDAGLTEDWGLSVGKVMASSVPSVPTTLDEAMRRAAAAAAAGSDARMAGSVLPVMINSGSGNQGITASVPVVRYAEHIGASREKLCRALLVSDLVTIHIKSGIGRLSAYCGAVGAGVGAGAGIAYLLAGDYETIAHTIVNAVAILSGTICDGAKPSCAAKIAASVEAGILGYHMYKNGQEFKGGDGIVTKGVDNTIANIGVLAKEGMRETDHTILSIMTQRCD